MTHRSGTEWTETGEFTARAVRVLRADWVELQILAAKAGSYFGSTLAAADVSAIVWRGRPGHN
jgi:hypothetical protein